MNFFDYMSNWYHHAVNVLGYTQFELVLFFTGFVSWFAAYILILKGVRKFKINEMPLMVGPGNWVWEFIWGFMFEPELGKPFIYGVRLWFFLDVFINVTILVFGYKQLPLPVLKKRFRYTYIIALIFWFFTVWTFGKVGDDNPLGVTSALMINVIMSGLYLYQLVFNANLRGKGLSFKVAILKCIGTGVITLGSIFKWPDALFLINLGVISFVIDIIYIVLFKQYKPIKEEESWEASQEELQYSVEV